MHGRYPERAIPVDQRARNPWIIQPLRSIDAFPFFGLGVEYRESVRRREHHAAIGAFSDREDLICDQPIIDRERPHGGSVVAHDALKGHEPDVPSRIRGHDACGFGSRPDVVLEVGPVLAIESKQTLIGRDPQPLAVVQGEGVDPAGRQPLCCAHPSPRAAPEHANAIVHR